MLLIFLDTETTGLNPDKHRTIEIAFKVLDSSTSQILDGYESIVSQPAEIWAAADPDSLAVNGFTWEQCLKGKPEKVVASEIANDLNRIGIVKKPSAFVCQNPSFDRAFFSQLIHYDLQADYRWPYHWLDFASMYWALQTSKNPKAIMKESDLSKDMIAKSLGLPDEKTPHRAIGGVEHLISCYQALFQKNKLY